MLEKRNKVRAFAIMALFLILFLFTASCGSDDAENVPKNKRVAVQRPATQDTGPDIVDRWSEPAKGLKNTEWRWRKKAAEKLGRLGSDAVDAVPLLVRTLEDKNEEVRMAVVKALGDIGPQASGAASYLIWSLSDTDMKVRAEAVEALVKIGTEVVPPLSQMIDRNLGKIGRKSLSGSTRSYLTDEDWRVLSRAARVLEKIGPSSQYAIKTLMRLAKIQCGSARSVPSCHVAQNAASDALNGIGKSALPFLLGSLKSHDSNVRSAAAKAIGRIGPEAAEAVPILVEMLKEKDSSISGAAATALGGIGAPALPALIGALHDMRPMIREPAVKALRKMGPAAAEAKPELKKMLNDPKRWTRRAAKDVLRKI